MYWRIVLIKCFVNTSVLRIQSRKSFKGNSGRFIAVMIAIRKDLVASAGKRRISSTSLAVLKTSLNLYSSAQILETAERSNIDGKIICILRRWTNFDVFIDSILCFMVMFDLEWIRMKEIGNYFKWLFLCCFMIVESWTVVQDVLVYLTEKNCIINLNFVQFFHPYQQKRARWL